MRVQSCLVPSSDADRAAFVAIVDAVMRVVVTSDKNASSSCISLSQIGRLVADLYTGDELSGFCDSFDIHCADKRDDYPCQGCFVTAIENAMHSKAGVLLASGNRGYA